MRMPVFEVIDQISLGGFRDRANEDRLGLAGRHAWVIDGATGLGEPFMGAGSDAAWLAQRTHEAFTRLAFTEDPAELMAEAAEDLIAAFETERTREVREPWELPCGAFLLASASADGLTLTWAGDCRALVKAEAGPLMAFGATPMSEEAEAGLVARLSGGDDPAQRYKEPSALAELRRQRGVALARGDALILAPDRGFLAHMRSARVAGSRFDVLLMTDGFAAAELRYGLFPTPAALLDAAARGGLGEIGRELRRFEHVTDPDGRLRPRWKRSDDASAIWLKLAI